MFPVSHSGPSPRLVVLGVAVLFAVSTAYAGAASPIDRSGLGPSVPDNSGPGSTVRAATPALTVARDLADESTETITVPPDLVAALGYEPVFEDGVPTNPDGDCSSPVPLPERFEPVCRIHDLGYDLLRVAHSEGTPIPPGLRRDLDTLMADRMRDTCDDEMPCRAAAGLARVAVHLNTVRQGHGAPVEEQLPW